MNEQDQAVLDRVHSAPAPNYLRPSQIEDINNEKAVLEHTLKQPGVQEPGIIHAQIRQANAQLHRHTPPDTSPDERDRIAKDQTVLEEFIKEGMPSRDEQMRNPQGNVYRHIEWERNKKRAINWWKANQLRLHKGSDDPNIANVENLRPAGNPIASYVESQIPRKAEYSVPSDQYRANYDGIDWQEKVAKLEAENEALRQDVEALARPPEPEPEKPQRPQRRRG